VKEKARDGKKGFPAETDDFPQYQFSTIEKEKKIKRGPEGAHVNQSNSILPKGGIGLIAVPQRRNRAGEQKEIRLHKVGAGLSRIRQKP